MDHLLSKEKDIACLRQVMEPSDVLFSFGRISLPEVDL
jgi:hypothetical protein